MMRMRRKSHKSAGFSAGGQGRPPLRRRIKCYECARHLQKRTFFVPGMSRYRTMFDVWNSMRRSIFNAICRGGRLCPPSKFVDFSWSFVGADVGIGPYGAEWETRRFFAGLAWFFIPFVGADDIESLFLTVTCRGGRLCPPSKFIDFSWSFVGADAHIGPLECCEFALDFRKTGRFMRVDVGIDPYGAEWETRRFFAGRAWFLIPFVGVDDIESLF